MEALALELAAETGVRSIVNGAGMYEKAKLDRARKLLQAAAPALHARWLEQLKEALTGLHNGPGPDRDTRYQDAWRHGVSDALDALTKEGD